MLPQQSQPLTPRCCEGGVSQAPPLARRGLLDLTVGAVSVGVWMFLPKCPICLAAHLALWTGLGLSVAEAAYLRWSLLALSGVLLIWIVAKRVKRASFGPPASLAAPNSANQQR